jgi:hypothetical protein
VTRGLRGPRLPRDSESGVTPLAEMRREWVQACVPQYFAFSWLFTFPHRPKAQVEPPAWPEYAAYPFRPGLFWTDVGLSVLYDTNFELTKLRWRARAFWPT